MQSRDVRSGFMKEFKGLKMQIQTAAEFWKMPKYHILWKSSERYLYLEASNAEVTKVHSPSTLSYKYCWKYGLK